jgi:hypothetical protein
MRTAAICPTCATYTNAVCVLYDGPYLSNLDIDPLTDLEEVIGIIDAKVGTLQPALGFTPENVANKSTNVSLGTSNTLYPTQNAVKTYVDNALSVISDRVYVAVISMVDGSIINLLKNTLGDTLTWVASSGTIATTSAVLASENNTFISVTSGSATPKIVSADIAVSSLSWNVSIYQTDNAGVPNSTDAVYVEIRIY